MNAPIQLVRRLALSQSPVARPAVLLAGGCLLSGGWWLDTPWRRHYRWARSSDGNLRWFYFANNQWFCQGTV